MSNKPKVFVVACSDAYGDGIKMTQVVGDYRDAVALTIGLRQLGVLPEDTPDNFMDEVEFIKEHVVDVYDADCAVFEVFEVVLSDDAT